MRRRTAVFLAAGAMWAATQAAVGPATSSADRPISDITCAPGTRATYDHGRHRFEDAALVLGCVHLAGGGRLQLDAAPGGELSAPTCFFLTGPLSGPGPMQGIHVCPRRVGAEPRVLLLLRHPGPRPFMAMGIVPPAAKRIAVGHSTAAGTLERTPAKLIRGRGGVAREVGAPGPFGAFVAEIGPHVSVCRGVEPLAFTSGGSVIPARPAVPGPGPLGRPDGWLAGFAPTYGIGFGPGKAPVLCPRASRAGGAAPEPARPLAQLRLALERVADLLGSAFSAIPFAA